MGAPTLGLSRCPAAGPQLPCSEDPALLCSRAVSCVKHDGRPGPAFFRKNPWEDAMEAGGSIAGLVRFSKFRPLVKAEPVPLGGGAELKGC